MIKQKTNKTLKKQKQKRKEKRRAVKQTHNTETAKASG